jgi:hypothetical protein
VNAVISCSYAEFRDQPEMPSITNAVHRQGARQLGRTGRHESQPSASVIAE